MIKKNDLKSFSLYEFLKRQNNHSLAIPFFLANNATYKNAHVSFPFRTFTYGLGITYASASVDKVKIGNIDYEIKAGCLTTIGPGIVCTWSSNYTAEHDTIYFTEELFNGYKNHSFLQSLRFFSHGGKHVISLTDEQVKKISILFNALKELKDDTHAIPGVVHSLLMLVDSIHSGAGYNQAKAISARERIISEFRKLVAERYIEHKEVAFYAASLHITPKYLSEVLQDELGKTAKKFIEEFVMMEAKSILKQTSLSVQEISYWLGYKDASSFAKIFKKQTGTSPSAYRVE